MSPENKKSIYHRSYEKHKEHRLEYGKQRRQKSHETGMCYRCGAKPAEPEHTCCQRCADLMKAYNVVYRQKHKEKFKIIDSSRRHQLRKQVIEHYGGKCTCCGETEISFLVIDHINGGGHQHIKSIGRGGGNLYYWIVKNNYPDSLQVLCHNCNASKYALGICAHQSASAIK